MTSESYRAPKVSSILIGIILAVILLIFMCTLSQGVKYAGTGLMVVPSSLGVVRQVQREEVQNLFMKNSPTLVIVNTPGKFQVYTDDYDLLTTTMQLSDSKSPPWMKIKNAVTGAVVNVEYIHRGLRIYDTPLAKGRPILTFDITAPGSFEITHPERSVSIYLVPDYTTGRESAINLWFGIQIAALAAVFAFLYTRQRAKKMKAIREIDELGKRRRGKDFWQAQTEKHQERDR